ncbi:PepSY-associated TM helix domain-containing protein [Massilia genomosp. 1]|uniref:PepSY domain-containing protein n=1 Tax=Massilia genomosp. 1 TaxID=2609280 RepID=A0ABX0N617_9BURK|nr:PepSY-associated TM helix domain-containing protein [Massilia genomosp. 1]NHZ65559.1 PepSY domain-containing protein [Massilia genomosp. 1]
MKADIVRTYKVVHTWVGILSGVMLFIAFYAGAFTMFKPEIGRWAEAQPDAQQGASSPLDPLASAFFAARDPVIGSAVLVLDPERPGYGRMRYFDKQGATWQVTLDAAGRLQTTAAQTGPAGHFVDEVHRNGGLPLAGAVAEPVIGFVALLYALALISGVVILLPSLIKDLLLLRIGANVKRFWLDAHNLIGITSLPFHLAIALTTAGFCLHDWVYDTQDATIDAIGKPAAAQARAKGKPGPDTSANWVAPSRLLASARVQSRTLTPTELTYRGLNSPTPQVNMGGEDWSGHMRAPRAGFMNFNPVSGQLNKGISLLPHQQNNWEASLSAIFALHFGSFGGVPVRLAYVVMGLLGAILFYTGNLLWIESRLRKNRQLAAPLPQPRHVRAVAALTVGLCLGAVIGLPLGLVALRWQAALGLAMPGIGLAVFNAALAIGLLAALGKGAAWAAYRLSFAAALATLLVPATSVLAYVFPGLPVGKPYAGDYLWIDGLSLLGGALLLWMAVRVRRRARSGEQQSVWRELGAAMPPQSTNSNQKTSHQMTSNQMEQM